MTRYKAWYGFSANKVNFCVEYFVDCFTPSDSEFPQLPWYAIVTLDVEIGVKPEQINKTFVVEKTRLPRITQEHW